jgi:hypothetical protein
MVNMGQIMSIGSKNEFQAVLGQNCHFLVKTSLPSQYESNHVNWDKK